MDVLVSLALDARYGLDCDCSSINKMFKEAIQEEKVKDDEDNEVLIKEG